MSHLSIGDDSSALSIVTTTVFWFVSCLRELITLSSFSGELGSNAGFSFSVFRHYWCDTRDGMISYFVLPYFVRSVIHAKYPFFLLSFFCCFSFRNISMTVVFLEYLVLSTPPAPLPQPSNAAYTRAVLHASHTHAFVINLHYQHLQV